MKKLLPWGMVAVLGLGGLLPDSLSAAEAETAAGVAKMNHLKRYAVREPFEDVREMLELAITERGLVINNVLRIGEMLERTRKVVGSKRQIYLKAEALAFCSASLSRKMMEADPHNIVFCPYLIFIYVMPEQPDTVYLAYRRPLGNLDAASSAVLAEVEALLDGIIRDLL